VLSIIGIVSEWIKESFLYREKIGKAKAKLKISLAAGIKENKKLFYKYINSKRRAKENLHPLLDVAGNMSTEDK